MARTNSEPKVSTAMLERHRTGWHHFTQAIVKSCVAIAVLLLLMLLFLRVL